MDMKISVLVSTKEQFEVVKEYSVDSIYTSNYDIAMANPFVYYQTPKYPCTKKMPHRLLCGDVGWLMDQEKHTIVTDYNLNIANHWSIEELLKRGATKITPSLECSIQDLEKLSSYPLEVFVYGHVVVMTLKSHPLFKENGYELEDYQKRRWTVLVDDNEVVSLLSAEPINKLDELAEYQSIGIHSFRLDFTIETKDQVKKIMDFLKAFQHKEKIKLERF